MSTTLVYDFTGITTGTWTLALPLKNGTLTSITWGDGSTDTATTTTTGELFYLHTYTLPLSTVIVTANGTFTNLSNLYMGQQNNVNPSAIYLTDCFTYGSDIIDLNHAFFRCSALNSVALPPSGITNMNNMFSTMNYNQDFSTWNNIVTTVTNMSYMFFENVNVTGLGMDGWVLNPNGVNCNNMFTSSTNFNGNLGTWTVEHITDFGRMFFAANAFTGIGLDQWELGATGRYMPEILSRTAITIPTYNSILTKWSTAVARPPQYSTNKIYSNEASSARATFLTSNAISALDLGIDLAYPFSLYDDPVDITWNGGTIGNTYRLTINGSLPGVTAVCIASGATSKVPFIVDFTGVDNPTPGDPMELRILDGIGTVLDTFILTDDDVVDVCFNEGTQILHLNKQLADEYVRIELLRAGDFVKTFKHGYRKIDLIGKNSMVNTPNIFSKCMYKMEKTETNGLIEDLIVTGGHSIMVDEMTEEERELNEELFHGPSPKIDNKYLLLAAASNKFAPMQNKDPYVYYHFVVENDGDNEARYGVWANGVLTETPSKEYFTKRNFTLL